MSERVTDPTLFDLPREPSTAWDTVARREVALRILWSLANVGPGTPDEIAARLGLDVLSVRPAATKLRHDGDCYLTGKSKRTALNSTSRELGITTIGRQRLARS